MKLVQYINISTDSVYEVCNQDIIKFKDGIEEELSDTIANNIQKFDKE